MNYTQNLVRRYAQATREETQAGLEWYDAAKALAHNVAVTATKETGVRYTEYQVAGVIAALSPRVVWREQERYTLGLVIGHALGHFDRAPHPGTYANRDKARRILDGEPPLSVLGGEKVRAFYANIVGLDRSTPTLDIWAVRAAVNIPLGVNGVGYLTQGKRRQALVEAYVDAAAEAGVAVCDFQAVVWVQARNYFSVQRECAYCGGPLNSHTCKDNCWRDVFNAPARPKKVNTN